MPYILSSQVRTWTMETTSNTCEASLAAVVGEGVVRLAKTNGTTPRAIVGRLVEADRVYLRGFLKVRGKAALWPDR